MADASRSRYPGVPAPTYSTSGLFESVSALIEGYQLLTGQNGTDLQALLPSDMKPDIWNTKVQVLEFAGTAKINYTKGRHVALKLSGNSTVSFKGWPPSRYPARLTVEVQQGLNYNITWVGVIWPNSTAPTVTVGAGKLDTYEFTTVDSGHTIKGIVVGQDFGAP